MLYDNYKAAMRKCSSLSSVWTNRNLQLSPSTSNASTPSPTPKGYQTHYKLKPCVFLDKIPRYSWIQKFAHPILDEMTLTRPLMLLKVTDIAKNVPAKIFILKQYQLSEYEYKCRIFFYPTLRTSPGLSLLFVLKPLQKLFIPSPLSLVISESWFSLLVTI